MTVQELMKLRNSNEAPFNHQQYTLWLYNKIIENVRHEILEMKENPFFLLPNKRPVCDQIMSLPSLNQL
jgi:hypothetical protein